MRSTTKLYIALTIYFTEIAYSTEAGRSIHFPDDTLKLSKPPNQSSLRTIGLAHIERAFPTSLPVGKYQKDPA